MSEETPQLGLCCTALNDPLLQHLNGFPPGLILTTLLSAMSRNAITVWDREGTIMLANSVMARGHRQKSIQDLLGKNIKDLTPEPWALERIALVKQAIDSNQTITVLDIQTGCRMCCRIVPMIARQCNRELSCALITLEPISVNGYRHIQEQENHDLVVHAQNISLGKLDVLTSRELEILALMGQGLRTKEIAKQLSRSVSTIENHRDKIGMKLGVKDRSELIRMANLAVLQVEDASRTRINFTL